MEDKPEQKPWEMDWTEKPKQAIREVVEGVKKAVEGASMPWEWDWKAKPRKSIVAPPKTSPEAPSRDDRYLKENFMKEASSDLFTPEANKKRKAEMSSPYNINELKREIATTKDIKAKKILVAHLAEITKGM